MSGTIKYNLVIRHTNSKFEILTKTHNCHEHSFNVNAVVDIYIDNYHKKFEQAYVSNNESSVILTHK